MRKIISLLPTEDFQLKLKFEDGTEKKFDLKPYFQFPAFTILKDHALFKRVANHGYFIEWQESEVDLSADTLWHEGKLVN
jgi:Protein of unknown function (DUF2442)